MCCPNWAWCPGPRPRSGPSARAWRPAPERGRFGRDECRSQAGSLAHRRAPTCGVDSEFLEFSAHSRGSPMDPVPLDAHVPAIRILLVEDDPRVRAAIRAFLGSAADLDLVAEAASVSVALEMARKYEPAVALVDVMLPQERDGLFLLQALTGGLRIPAVAMSLSSELCGRALAA